MSAVELFEPQREEVSLDDGSQRSPDCLLCGDVVLAPGHRWLCGSCVAADLAEDRAGALAGMVPR